VQRDERAPFRAVLFDVGDTLLRLDADEGSLVRRAAAALGATVPAPAARKVWERVGPRASSAAELAKGRDLSPERHREVWTALYRACGADGLAAGLAEAIYAETIAASAWVTVPGAAAALRRLRRAGLRLGALSDTGFDFRPALAAAGLAEHLDAVVLSCEHGRCKPDPSLFATACAELGCGPAETLMVGDNPLTDGGAVRAGLATLLLPLRRDDPGVWQLVLRLAGAPAGPARAADH
jgi:HAD superfamily hydrolase (TIGR01509 family)